MLPRTGKLELELEKVPRGKNIWPDFAVDTTLWFLKDEFINMWNILWIIKYKINLFDVWWFGFSKYPRVKNECGIKISPQINNEYLLIWSDNWIDEYII